MNKSCARCTKIVYPIEELKCLDKTWHKTCFKCHECGMTLNMKTYKGFNKLPYCEAHIPKAKATAIADTPELKRIAENTKLQSNVKYHADFKKQIGKLTQVTDDPETLRLKQNSKIISNVAYHGDLEKKAAMEKQREVAEVSDNRDIESEYFSETLAAESLSQYQPQTQQTQHPIISIQQYQSVPGSYQQHQPNDTTSQSYASQNSKPKHQLEQEQLETQYTQQKYSQPATNNHHNNSNYQSQVYAQQQQPQQLQQSFTNIRSSVVQSAVNPSGGGGAANAQANNKQHQQQLQQQIQQQYYDQYENYARPSAQNTPIYNNNTINSINNNHTNASMAYNNAHHAGSGYGSGNVAGNNIGHGNAVAYRDSGNNASAYNNQYNNHAYSTDGGLNSSAAMGAGGIGKISDYDPLTDGPRNVPNTTRPSSTLIFSSDRGMVSNNQPRKIGSVADIDPANGVYGSMEYNNYGQQSHSQQQVRHPQQQQSLQQNLQSQTSQQKPIQKSISSQVRVFRALYDYEAQDTDEVSFTEGDLIFEVDSIDAGWMTGRVERTGQTGMLPANYVEPAMI